MSLNFVPNGKTKGMTKDSQQISAAEASKGKGAANQKNKPKQEGVGPDGKLSKAALKKQQKKDAKKAQKSGAAASAAAASNEEQSKIKGEKPKPIPAEGAVAPKSSGLQSIELKSGYFSGPVADLWEEILENQQWFGGSKLTQADAEAARIIKGQFPKPDVHPSLFAWVSIATKFTESVMAKWPAGECPLPDGFKRE